MKTLVLLRHAKSSWDDSSLDDFDRPLSGRGKRDAPVMGRRLAALGAPPDLIVTSPAKRARKTAAIVASLLDYDKKKIDREEAIYEAGVEALMEIVGGLGDEADRVMLVGHNPGLTDLANALMKERVENIPTCGALGLEFCVDSWRKVMRKGGRMIFFEVPPKSGRS